MYAPSTSALDLALRRAALRNGTITIAGGADDDPTIDPDAAPETPPVDAAELIGRLDDLSALDGDTLDETENALLDIARSLGAEQQTVDTVAAITQATEGILAIRSEREARTVEAERLATEAAAQLAQVLPEADPEPEVAEPVVETLAVEPAPEPTPEPAPAVVEVPAVTEPAPVAVLAADPEPTAEPANPVPVLDPGRPVATALQRVTARRPSSAAPESRPAAAAATPRGPRFYQVDANGLNTEGEFESLSDAARVFARVHDGIRAGNASDGTMHTIMSIRPEYPADRRVRALASEVDNMAVVASAMRQPNGDPFPEGTDMLAMVASGGLCAPVTAYYEQAHIGDNARPLRAALPAFGADRGGIRFVAPVSLATITNNAGGAAITTVTMTQDAANTQKTKQTVTCPAVTEVDVEAEAARLGFGNVLSRTFPERVTNILEVTMDAIARVAERRILTAIGTGSKTVTVALSGLGVGADFLEAVTRGAAAYRNRHRMNPTATLQVIAPAWLLDALMVDMSVGVSLDLDFWQLNRAQVESLFTRIGIQITWTRDGEAAGNGLTNAQDFAAQAGLAAALVDYPDQVVWYLFHPGAWLFLDGGELNIGLVRDSTLNNTNDYEIMYEFFENVAFVGLESLRVIQTFCASGTRALGKDVSASCTSKVGFGS